MGKRFRQLFSQPITLIIDGKELILKIILLIVFLLSSPEVFAHCFDILPYLVPFPNTEKVTPWGIAIPGLGMNGSELPEIPGLYRVNNPGVGNAPSLKGPYLLEDIAAVHAQVIAELAKGSKAPFLLWSPPLFYLEQYGKYVEKYKR